MECAVIDIAYNILNLHSQVIDIPTFSQNSM